MWSAVRGVRTSVGSHEEAVLLLGGVLLPVGGKVQVLRHGPYDDAEGKHVRFFAVLGAFREHLRGGGRGAQAQAQAQAQTWMVGRGGGGS